MASVRSSFAHSRQNSDQSNASGTSYQLILEHILSYPNTYEIPLRTMYTLNCAPRAQPPSTHQSRAPSPTSSSGSPTSPTFPYDQQAATAQFTSALMDQLSQLPLHSSSLPPAFVTSFVNRCFPVELECVDFPQSLTALDYLKDLEVRRSKEIVNSFRTLDLDQSNLSSEKIHELRSWNPAVADWVESLENKLRKVEALYTSVYISLRRWILINEMCLEPFSKNNCLAMLNTLYPPVMSSQPTAKLTIATLQTQREGFFKYIQTVEKRGTGCLATLMKQGRREGEVNGWPAARRVLSQYLALANSIINECWDINNLRFNVTRPLGPAAPPPATPTAGQDSEKRHGKMDSGVSFGPQGQQHYKSDSTSSAKSAPVHRTPQVDSIGKGGTALERLAREFRKIRPKQRSVNEIDGSRRPSFQTSDQESQSPTSPSSVKPKGSLSRLRKMKSLGTLHDNSSSNSILGFSRAATPTFDPKEMKRHRDAYERRAVEMSFP
ncbi:uncharacterized protein PV09_05637 [Verruconis gallopava]|uniref:Uncharacterized protein n=1 Tax=Verruconis gallopava TaxID=253628 RepID=A0A0D1XKX0_9PEZI|nr:uncharacterized protein PV09_05637 [Verruconis gallopava]KIW02976.1 hypothetical protein PV09_05637 [Verruconis gallopava]